MIDNRVRQAGRATIEQSLTERALQALSAHPSFAQFVLPAGAEGGGGACLVEPSVACLQCGYCQSYGC